MVARKSCLIHNNWDVSLILPAFVFSNIPYGGLVEFQYFVNGLNVTGSDILPYQLTGLFLKGAINGNAPGIGLYRNIIHRRECAVIIDERPQEGIRGNDLVEHLDFFVFLEKRLAPFRIAEVLDQGIDILIVKVPFNQRQVCWSLLLL